MMPGPKCLPLLLALVTALNPWGAAWARPACQSPAELLRMEERLPAVAHAIAAGELRLLVVGSASVRGPGGSGPEAAWPVRLQALLGERFPGLAVRLDL